MDANQPRTVKHCSVQPMPIQSEDLLAIKTVNDIQLSPDGTRVAYVLSEIDAEKDAYRTTIWVGCIEGSEPEPFTRGPVRDSAPRWSPDGSRLAFLSDREGESAQLYVMPTDGGEGRKLTSLGLGAGPAPHTANWIAQGDWKLGPDPNWVNRRPRRRPRPAGG